MEESFAIVGAAGKMGRGIALLCLQRKALIKCTKSLQLIDVNEDGFYELKVYLLKHLTKWVEKNIHSFRKLYEEHQALVSNEEIIKEVIEKSILSLNCSKALEHLEACTIIFEAVYEDISLKVNVLKKIGELAKSSYVFTNTSSIPISFLAEKSGLKEHLIGMHFYNPPSQQKLLEIIPSKFTEKKILEKAFEIGKQFNKVIVVSKDIAGFIGNGHFAREILFACQLVDSLSKQYSQEDAIGIVDHVTKDFLQRPMGIFELLDYVGLPIAYNIFTIMREHIPDNELKTPQLLEQFKEDHIVGGQTIEGYPKDGIFSYEKGKKKGIYSHLLKRYQPLNNLDGSLTEQLGKEFLRKSFEIENHLVETGVASSLEDVGIVLKNGFHHSFAPHEKLRGSL